MTVLDRTRNATLRSRIGAALRTAQLAGMPAAAGRFFDLADDQQAIWCERADRFLLASDELGFRVEDEGRGM